MITREYLEQRLQEITATRNKLLDDVNANNGAIQLLRHLLASLDLEDKATRDIDGDNILDSAPKPNGEDAAGPESQETAEQDEPDDLLPGEEAAGP